MSCVHGCRSNPFCPFPPVPSTSFVIFHEYSDLALAPTPHTSTHFSSHISLSQAALDRMHTLEQQRGFAAREVATLTDKLDTATRESSERGVALGVTSQRLEDTKATLAATSAREAAATAALTETERRLASLDVRVPLLEAQLLVLSQANARVTEDLGVARKQLQSEAQEAAARRAEATEAQNIARDLKQAVTELQARAWVLREQGRGAGGGGWANQVCVRCV